MNTAQNTPAMSFPVKITINSRHVLPQMGNNPYSMFGAGDKAPVQEGPTGEQIRSLMEELDNELEDDAELEDDMVEQIEDMFRTLFEAVAPDDENSNRYVLTTEAFMESDDTEYRLKYIEKDRKSTRLNSSHAT